MRELAGSPEGVTGAGVHVACLQADDDRATWPETQHALEIMDIEGALAVGSDLLHGCGSQTQQSQGAIDGGMTLDARQDADLRSTVETVPLDVPPVLGQDVVTGGGKSRRIRLLGSRDEADACRVGDGEQLLEPRPCDGFDGRRCGRQGRVEGALVPARCEHVGSGRCGQRTTDDEPEEPRTDIGHQTGFGSLDELVDDRCRSGRACRQVRAECPAHGRGVNGSGYRPLGHGRPELSCLGGSPTQEIAEFAHDCDASPAHRWRATAGRFQPGRNRPRASEATNGRSHSVVALAIGT